MTILLRCFVSQKLHHIALITQRNARFALEHAYVVDTWNTQQFVQFFFFTSRSDTRGGSGLQGSGHPKELGDPGTLSTRLAQFPAVYNMSLTFEHVSKYRVTSHSPVQKKCFDRTGVHLDFFLRATR